MDHLEHAKFRAEDYSKEGYEKLEGWLPIIAHALIAIAERLDGQKELLDNVIFGGRSIYIKD